MNERLEKYLAKKNQEKQMLKNQEKITLLIREGLYDEVFAGRGNEESQKENVESRWNADTQEYEYYKKVPILITDEEYKLLKEACKPDNEKLVDTNVENGIATALTIIAWGIYIVGLIAGISFGTMEVTHGTYYTYSTHEFSFAIAFIYWASCFVAGTMILGFAEIIRLLQAIKCKG